MRKSKLPKPDLVLRNFPLEKVLPCMEKVTQHVALHPDNFWLATPRQACFCGKKSTLQMTKCQDCDEWFHHKCTGLTEEQAAQLDDWTCGYCLEGPDEDGNCHWKLVIPQPKKGAAPVPPIRNVDASPRMQGIDTDVNATLDSWEDIEAFCRESGRKLNLEMMKNRKRAAELVKAAGHHVGDEMSAGGLATRVADDRLVDEFVGIGLIESDLVQGFD